MVCEGVDNGDRGDEGDGGDGVEGVFLDGRGDWSDRENSLKKRDL